MVVAVQDEGGGVPTARVEELAREVLGVLGLHDAELSVVVCDDTFIRPLNATWRGKDAATDVLSFPQDDPVVLGDVVVSVETATRQAIEQGHDLWTEIRVLLVHGVLHLLGYDHVEPDEAEEMRAEEARILGEMAGAGLIARNR